MGVITKRNKAQGEGPGDRTSHRKGRLDWAWPPSGRRAMALHLHVGGGANLVLHDEKREEAPAAVSKGKRRVRRMRRDVL